MRDNEIFLRKLNDNENDYKCLEKWYKVEDVYKNFEQRILNYDEIKSKYSERVKSNSSIPVYIIEYNNQHINSKPH